MYDLRGRHDGVLRPVALVHVFDHALRDARGRAIQRLDRGERPVGVIAVAVQRRHIHAADLTDLAQKFRLCPALALCRAVEGENFGRHLLALADGEKVDKIRQRLGVHRAHAAREHKVVQSLALRCQLWHARQLQHIEHIRVAHLIAQRKGDEVKVAHGVLALQRVERDAMLAHRLLHIAPGREHALTPHAGQFVHHVVEDAHSDVGHPDLVGVGEAERHAQIDRALVLDDLVIFPADVARGLLYALQNAVQLVSHAVCLIRS